MWNIIHLEQNMIIVPMEHIVHLELLQEESSQICYKNTRIVPRNGGSGVRTGWGRARRNLPRNNEVQKKIA